MQHLILLALCLAAALLTAGANVPNADDAAYVNSAVAGTRATDTLHKGGLPPVIQALHGLQVYEPAVGALAQMTGVSVHTWYWALLPPFWAAGLRELRVRPALSRQSHLPLRCRPAAPASGVQISRRALFALVDVHAGTAVGCSWSHRECPRGGADRGWARSGRVTGPNSAIRPWTRFEPAAARCWGLVVRDLAGSLPLSSWRGSRVVESGPRPRRLADTTGDRSPSCPALACPRPLPWAALGVVRRIDVEPSRPSAGPHTSCDGPRRRLQLAPLLGCSDSVAGQHGGGLGTGVALAPSRNREPAGVRLGGTDSSVVVVRFAHRATQG